MHDQLANEIAHVTDRAMTARHIIEALQDLDPDSRVLFVCGYGDYHDTQQVLPVTEIEQYSTSDLTTTPYSKSGLAMVENDDSYDDDDTGHEEPIIIMRM
jgi:hypothetical protein